MKFLFNIPSLNNCKLALIYAVILIICGYFANNMSIFTGEIVKQYYLVDKIIGRNNVDYGDAVYYNISYDKELVPAVQNNNDTVGYSAISDRGKLNEFLTLLQKSNKYKYIVIDMVFDNNDVSPSDSILFNTIRNTDRLVFANHDSICFHNSLIEDKAALVSYYSTLWSTNFARYEYMNDGRTSMPLYMYEHINSGKKMKCYGFSPFKIYFIDGKLCQNSTFLIFNSSPFPYNNDDYSKNDLNFFVPPFENVGEFLNSSSLYEESDLFDIIDENTRNKIVVIGDLIGDIHDTYNGTIPGSVILMRAYQTLDEGSNIVSFFNQLYWLIVFFIISLTIICKKPFITLLNNTRESKSVKKPIIRFIRFIISIITFSSSLVIFSIIEYCVCNHVYSLTIPIIFFTLLKLYTVFKNSQVYV